MTDQNETSAATTTAPRAADRARKVLIDITPLRESPPFRRIFIARVISLIGIGMLLVAVPVQMWDLTQSSAHVGAASAVTGITTFGGMLLGGMLADRFDRKLLIIIGRSGAAASFAGLAANAFGVFGGEVSVTALYLLAGVDGLVGALSVPALMAAVPTLLRRDLMMAVGALSSLSVRLGTAISPGIAGFVIAGAGVEWAYVTATVLACIALVVLAGLPSMPPGPSVSAAEEHEADRLPATATGESGESVVRFIFRERVVGGVMAVGVLAMLGAGVVALLPALVAERFSDDARATGLLYAATAVGAMIGALTSGWLASTPRPGRVLLAALMAGFGLQILFGAAPFVWLAIGLLALTGVAGALQEVLRYGLIQQHTPDQLLGRVNALWMAQEVGGVTVGALVAGLFGTLWAASDAVMYYGAVMLGLAVVATAILGTLRRVRPQPTVTTVLVD